ncbi:fumarylacetoacetate hydrolase family protein [Piscinibacter sp. XHJ-5]|uniref:fumarylacetoacetate hydrolase family protein n=1 Tax=Piscinibacter sp. XHJ-5 TaxID=3037797 RepID=UPI002452D207|nr:fumarylacetoacetate hydrolase family protein [Piscinibacter sp. XHJ-5]
MPSQDPVRAVTDALLLARRESRSVDAAPLRDALRDADAAYAVQAAVAEALGWFDGTPRHWKSGGASRTAALAHSPLPPSGVWTSPATARSWPFRLRIIEAEIALRLKRDVAASNAASLTPDETAGLVDAMAVSIEMVDSRFTEGVSAPALLRLADLQSHGALVLGDWRPYQPRDWSAQTCRVRVDGKVVDEKTGTHPLGDPAWLVPGWLRHVARAGTAVPAGSVVTTGAWIVVPDTPAGSFVEVEFDGLGLASIQL